MSMTTPTSSTEEPSSFIVTPDKGVKDPEPQDVLCGRGGSINSHAGNEKFRTLVEKRKRVYLTARFKREKRLIANTIVNEIRANHGRFLSRDVKTGLWKDIGDEKARDKTSQALRENAPSIRAEIEEELYKEESKKQQYAAPPPSGSYYGSWYPPYYGYSHPPPPPHAAPSHHAPPPPPHGYHPPPPDHYAQPPPPHYDYYGTAPDPYRTPAPPPAAPPATKSAMEQTAEFLNESIKGWTNNTSGKSNNHSTTSSFGGSVDGTVNSKPIAYRHEDRRKMVKFKDPEQRRNVRPCYSPMMMMDEDMEPQPMHADPNSTLMSQVATHILGNFGSWDTAICGNEKQPAPFPDAPPSQYEAADMAVEWEGQEVQLVDDRKEEESRMPPPQPREQAHHSVGSIAFSSLGSCHSWLPEQVGAAASYFSGRDNEMLDHSMTSGMHSLPTNSVMDMHSSVGGNSLTKVFEAVPETARSSIQQVPSWDRSFRSRSPISLVGDDDESLISKTSSKGALSPVQSNVSEDMAWTRRE